MNNIRVLLNAVKGRNIKVGITMNNVITYRCYVVKYIDTNHFIVTNRYEDYPLLNVESDNKKYNTIDVTRVGRVVVRANHVGKWKDVDKSVAESIPPTTLLSTLYYHHSISTQVYTHVYTNINTITDFLFSIYNANVSLHWNDI